MLLSFAVKLCGWFFAFDFCVYGFEVDPLRLWLYGWLFVRSGFCGLFVCVLLWNGDDAGGGIVVVICILNGNRHPAHGRAKAMRVTERKHIEPRCRLYKTGKHFS